MKYRDKTPNDYSVNIEVCVMYRKFIDDEQDDNTVIVILIKVIFRLIIIFVPNTDKLNHYTRVVNPVTDLYLIR